MSHSVHTEQPRESWRRSAVLPRRGDGQLGHARCPELGRAWSRSALELHQGLAGAERAMLGVPNRQSHFGDMEREEHMERSHSRRSATERGRGSVRPMRKPRLDGISTAVWQLSALSVAVPLRRLVAPNIHGTTSRHKVARVAQRGRAGVRALGRVDRGWPHRRRRHRHGVNTLELGAAPSPTLQARVSNTLIPSGRYRPVGVCLPGRPPES